MKHVLAAVVVVHGLIHLLGVAKAFGLAPLPELSQPIRPMMGVLWLVAATLFVASAAALYVAPRWWWLIAAVALAVSLPPLVASWPDTRAGVIAALIVAVGVVAGVRTTGPGSLRAQYDREVRTIVATPPSTADLLTDADLAALPPPVQRYIRLTGAVGQPRVRTYMVQMHGRIRSGPDARWMPFTARQVNGLTPLSRLFYMKATMFGLPAYGLHRYVGDAASMRVLVASLVPVADERGDEMTRAETVTLLNDLCVMAPGGLVTPAITWTPRDHLRAAATLTHAGHSVRAELVFDEDGALIDFWSDDRLAAAADGARMTPMRWSTPLRDYRRFGRHRLASRGEGRWHAPGGEYDYIDLTIDDVQYNVDAETAVRW